MTLTDQQQAEVRARAQGNCQRQQPGCQHICIYIEPTYTPTELAALRRDPNNPDNWLCTCINCHTK